MARDTKTRRVLPAQEPLWERHYRRFLRQVRDPEAAADLFQDLRLKVLEWTLQHGEPKCVSAFAATVARSVFADWCRKKLRSGRALAPFDESMAEEIPDSGADSHERLEAVRWARSVHDELDGITTSPMQREILAAWDEPADAVAEAVGSTVVAIRTYRYKLARRLRKNPRLRELALAA